MKDHGLPLRPGVFLLGALVSLLSLPSAARGDACANPYTQINSEAVANSINLNGADGGAGICDDCLDDAGQEWNDACTTGQTPRFETGGSGGIPVSVGFHSGTNPGTIPNCSSSKCGCTSTTIEDGRITGATVSLFQSAAGTSNCEGDWTAVLTHELGHVLGLQEASACTNRIMGNVHAGINSNDCDGADGNFLSGPEIESPEPDHPCSNPPV